MSNLEKLKDAGVIADTATLTSAEAKVIEGLSDAEVSTLIGIRQKLADEMAKDSAALDAPDVSSNFIV
jgi:hypothetical protein